MKRISRPGRYLVCRSSDRTPSRQSLGADLLMGPSHPGQSLVESTRRGNLDVRPDLNEIAPLSLTEHRHGPSVSRARATLVPTLRPRRPMRFFQRPAGRHEAMAFTLTPDREEA